VNQSGKIAINLKEEDQLIAVKRVAPTDMVMMASSAGKAIKCDEAEFRPMGRDTTGVRGITLPPGAHMLSLEVCNESHDPELFVVTEKGYGKRTDVSEYPLHHRGGQGVFTINMTAKNGQLADMKIVRPGEEMMIMSEEGVVVRTAVSGVSKQGRATQGVHVMKVAANDKITAVAISKTKAKRVGARSDDPREDIDAEEEE
jgi:DNA gyrase subunit A